MTDMAGDLIAGIALLVSIYALWTTTQFNRRQLALIASQEELNQRLLAQGATDALEAKKADVGAAYVKIGRSNYRIKIFNKGKAPARNVTVEFAEGESPVPDGELAAKFPMEVLERHQSVELIAAVHYGTPPKQTVTLKWADDHADTNEKTVHLTL